MLIEEGQRTSSATWYAAGLVRRMVASRALGALPDHAVDVYKRIGRAMRHDVVAQRRLNVGRNLVAASGLGRAVVRL